MTDRSLPHPMSINDEYSKAMLGALDEIRDMLDARLPKSPPQEQPPAEGEHAVQLKEPGDSGAKTDGEGEVEVAEPAPPGKKMAAAKAAKATNRGR